MTRKALQRQLDCLAFDVGRYVAKQYHRSTQIYDRLRNVTPAHIKSMMYVTEGFRAMDISDDGGLQMGRHNRLPKDLQRHFDFCFGEYLIRHDQDANEIATSEPSREERYPRWHLTDWTCSCGSHDTLWYKTHLAIKDRYQIYCASCRTLSGWGTKKDFETVKELGDGQDLIIRHPLDRERYKPQPLNVPPKTVSRPSVRAKRSQISVRAKQSQTPRRNQKSA